MTLALIARLLTGDDGAAIVEYAIVTAGLSVVAIAALQLTGVSLNDLYAATAANWTTAAQSGQ
jgi:Flp pilus assembly pilin Flp